MAERFSPFPRHLLMCKGYFVNPMLTYVCKPCLLLGACGGVGKPVVFVGEQ